jgi:hypothetical protein
VWTERILSALAAALLLFDGVMKLFARPAVHKALVRLGYPQTKIIAIGLLPILCTIIYLLLRTAIFGEILLTGYQGGAISTHLHVGDSLFSHVSFRSYVALLLGVAFTLASRGSAR